MKNKIILGIDEVGRGPYAGPLVVGACILTNIEAGGRETQELQEHRDCQGILENQGNKNIQDDYIWIKELADSKKLTAKKREELYEKIKEGAFASATGWVSNTEIDELGISESLKLACRRAVKQIQNTKVPFSEIIIDGTVNFLTGTPLEKYVSTLKKGDSLIKEISAASIIAKVERDRYMVKLAEKYPKYGFERHMGYGTKLHQEAMEKFGLTPEHRKSFRPVRAIFERSMADCNQLSDIPNSDRFSKNKNNTTRLGKNGEAIVKQFLEKQGQRVLTQNYKTKFFEIDIISIKDNLIIFTEVKYRKNADFGEPLSFINTKKQEQIRFAAKSFLAIHPEYRRYTPKLAVAGVVGENFQIQDWFILEE